MRVNGLLGASAGAERVGTVLAARHHGDELPDVVLAAEQLRDAGAQHAIGVRFQAVDLVADPQDFRGVVHVVEQCNGRLHALAADADEVRGGRV